MEGLPICLTVSIRPEHGSRERIHTHAYHELVFILDGTGRQATDKTVYHARRGEFYIFPSGTPHAAYCTEGEHQLLFVLYVPEGYFSSSAWDHDLVTAWKQLILRSARDHRITLDDDRPAAEGAREVIDALLTEFNEKRPGYRAGVRLRISELVLLLMRSSWWQSHIPTHRSSPSPRQLIHEAESYIHANWYREIRIEDVLAVCSVSRSHFHVLFRRYTGRTFVAYTNGVRIDHAKRRLAETDQSVSEISNQCGFSRPAYFSSVFRDFLGMTPREYRRSIAEQSRLGLASDIVG